jgi:hypothetical protein
MRRASQGILFSVVLAMGARAQAQEETPDVGFGDKGHFAITGERMFGYVHVSQDTTNQGGGTTTTTLSSISVLGGPVTNIASVYTFPRIGFDGFIAPSISVGGSLTYFHLSTSAGGNDNSLNGFLVAPRLGYVARLAPAVWLWPRAGITYVRVSNDLGGGSSATINLFAATAELPLVLALAPHAYALIGPTVDLGLSGSSKSSIPGVGTPPSNDIKETDIGLQASFLLYF